MKYAVVTGGTSGIGLQICIDLLKRGYFVFTNYANNDDLAREACLRFSQYSDNYHVQRANQLNLEEFTRFVSLIREKTSKVNCIVCNAGITIRKAMVDITNKEWEQVMQVIVNSHFYLIRDLYLLIEPNSRIIFIGSMMGVLPHATSLPYGVAKAALHALARNLVKDFSGTGTTVNAIAPGFVETEWQKNKPEEIRKNICSKTANGRFASVEEIADACMFCIDNSFVNGTILEINGGYCLE